MKVEQNPEHELVTNTRCEPSLITGAQQLNRHAPFTAQVKFPLYLYRSGGCQPVDVKAGGMKRLETKVFRLDTRHKDSFSIAQRLLHWLTAALVVFNLLLPDGMNVWKHAVRETGTATPEQVSGANIHAFVGIAILILVAARLFLRFTTGVPSSPPEEPMIFRVVAKVAHVALYLLLIAMPITGALAYYLGYSEAGDIHADILKVVLWALIGGHVVGALVHQFYWKTNVLRRMTIG